MSVINNSDAKVETFKFGQLIPSESPKNDSGEKFELKSLKDASEFKNSITDEIIRSEREHEAASSFEIDGLVKEHRGLQKQAEEDYEQRVAREVAARVEEIKESAYNEGYQQGLQAGEQKSYEESVVKHDQLVDQFSADLMALKEQMNEVYSKSQNEAYLMVKNLTKWIILKEVDEKYYLARLLEKLVHEINTKSNLLLKVNQSAFGYMPEIIKIVERRLGVLQNIRIETDYDMEENGIIIESENTIVDASLESQFQTIDRLFSNVGVNG